MKHLLIFSLVILGMSACGDDEGSNTAGSGDEGSNTADSGDPATNKPAMEALPLIKAGRIHFCTLDSSGALACWGGQDVLNPNRHEFYSDTPAGSFVALAVGGACSCAINAQGGIECWGPETCDAITEPLAGNFVSLHVQDDCLWALDAQGAITAKGNDRYDCLNPPSGVGHVAMTAGQCAIDAIGAITCTERTLQTHGAEPPTGVFTTIVGDNNHHCALDTEGMIHCWGLNLGGSVSAAQSRNANSNPPFRALALGMSQGGHNCVIDSAGRIHCWGGQAEFSGGAHLEDTPTEGNYTAIAAGAIANCAVDDSQAIVCWGSDTKSALSEAPARLE